MSSIASQSSRIIIPGYYLLQKVKKHFGFAIPLLVFVDCLVLLQILQKWGLIHCLPDPLDIIHFDVV